MPAFLAPRISGRARRTQLIRFQRSIQSPVRQPLQQCECAAGNRRFKNVGARLLAGENYNERSMNQGSNPPSGQPGGKGRRRRRGRRGPVSHTAPQNSGQQQHRHGPPKRHGRKHGPRPAGQAQTGGGIYTAPMDHSYRNLQGNNNGNMKQGRGRGGQTFGKQFMPMDPEPVPDIVRRAADAHLCFRR